MPHQIFIVNHQMQRADLPLEYSEKFNLNTAVKWQGRVATAGPQCWMGDSGCFHGNHMVNCTASFGVAGFAPDSSHRNATIDDMLLIASRGLMQTKAAGGNQTLCCP